MPSRRTSISRRARGAAIGRPIADGHDDRVDPALCEERRTLAGGGENVGEPSGEEPSEPEVVGVTRPGSPAAAIVRLPSTTATCTR